MKSAVLNKRSEQILDSVDHCLRLPPVHRDFSLRSELFDFQETQLALPVNLTIP